MSLEWDKLANLGGLALCVFVLIRAIVEVAKLWVADIKESAAREREGRNSLEELHRLTLAHIAASTAALGDLRGSIQTRNLEDTWSGSSGRGQRPLTGS